MTVDSAGVSVGNASPPKPGTADLMIPVELPWTIGVRLRPGDPGSGRVRTGAGVWPEAAAGPESRIAAVTRYRHSKGRAVTARPCAAVALDSDMLLRFASDYSFHFPLGGQPPFSTGVQV